MGGPCPGLRGTFSLPGRTWRVREEEGRLLSKAFSDLLISPFFSSSHAVKESVLQNEREWVFDVEEKSKEKEKKNPFADR